MFSANSSQVSGDKLFVEDVFSTYLYTGNGTTQTITNGIDLAGKGGLVWLKNRTSAYHNYLYDTTRGATKYILSSSAGAQGTLANDLTAFGATGFSLGNSDNNVSANNYASWTFREAPKFFDVVTYTGNGATSRAIPHNLGSFAKFIVIKRTDSAANWKARLEGFGNLQLNTTGPANDAASSTNGYCSGFDGTSFYVNASAGNADAVNASGGTYVAYIFAHDATSDGLIQCGTFTTNGSAVASVTLGWEPQWVMVKRTDGVANWIINDNMRGMSQTSFAELFPNTSGVEVSGAGQEIVPNATGFTTSGAANLDANATYIFVAIRRGPMRTPTLGTSVYNANNVTTASYSVGFPSDMVIEKRRSETFNFGNGARLMGGGFLSTNTANAFNSFGVFFWDEVTGNFRQGTDDPAFVWSFRRAPGFMDVVFYTGNGVAGRTVPHNLGVAPEMMIFKTTGNSNNWCVYNANLGASAMMRLNATDASNSPHPFINYTAPTSTVVTVGGDFNTNHTGLGQVAYLFASCPGVSKVGSYTGNGSSQTINCAFTTGARFVLIKRTDSTGDWYVWDTARGIVAGNDPHLSLNTTAAEVTTDDTIDTDSSGFVVNQVAATNVNVNAATYIYLAIA